MCIAARAGDSIHPGCSLGEMVQGGAGGTGGRQRVCVRKYIYISRGAGGQKGAQDPPQVPVRERAELGNT